VEDCLLWEGPHVGAGAECEEEGVAETKCDYLTATPIPRPPAPLRGRRQRNGIEVEPGKKGGVGERCFKIWFYFSLSCSDF